ncbi:MAG: efflux RND transporter periplasmic adaptor subunit [Dehalococcoidia bacterium]
MKLWKIIGLVVLAVVVVWGGYAIFGKLTRSGDALPDEGQVVEVGRGDLDISVSASGVVVAPHQANLSFESAGTVAELSVELGDTVSRGQVLARLETSSLERAVAQAEAVFSAAQLNLQKAQEPYDEKDFARAEAAVAQSEAGLKTAQLNLEKAQEPYDEKDIAGAEAAVSSAQAALKAAQDALEDTWKLYDGNAIADAEAAVRNAQVALENAQRDLESAQETQATNIAVAENSVPTLERAYIQAVDKHYNIGCTPAACSQVEPRIFAGGGTVEGEVDAAWIALVQARSALIVAQLGAVKAIATAENGVDKAGDTLRNAEQDLEDALEGADASDIEVKESQIESARAALRQAQAQLADIRAGADAIDIEIKEHEIESALATLRKAQAELADIKAGPDAVDIELSEAQVTSATIALAEAREKLEKAAITAPFDGLVASVSSKMGDKVMAGAVVIRLIDPGEFEVEATVDELDVYQVRPGQAVHISLDAIPGDTLSGTVTAMSPVAQRETGVISYQVIISLQPSTDIALKDGLTASTEIVIDSLRDVLLVPSRAVSRSGDDRVVQVVVSGKLQERVVETGTSSEGQTEILSGLSEGEKVLVEERGD